MSAAISTGGTAYFGDLIRRESADEAGEPDAADDNDDDDDDDND